MTKIYNKSMEKEVFNVIEVEEEVENISQILVSSKSNQWIKEETLAVVVRVDSNRVCRNFSTFDLCGKSMLDWVLLSLSVCDEKVVNEAYSEKLLRFLQDLNTDKKYIFITYSDIPLLERSTFYKIMDYFSSNNLNAMKFDHGYVYKAEFLKEVDSLEPVVKKTFGGRDFFVVEDASDISEASRCLQERIRQYHMNNDVVLLGEETIFIDADVEIESGVVIHPNNILKGQSYIGKNVILESGNIISDSIISDNCIVEKSVIVKSKITENKVIRPFSLIENQSV